MNIDIAIATSKALRPCSFDPSQFYESEFDQQSGVMRNFLSSTSKLMWFYTYCNENELLGQVLTTEPVFQTFGNSVLVTVTATVVIQGNTESTASAAQSFTLNDTFAMDRVVQMASSSAIGKALGNAGFGVFGSFDTGTPSSLPASVVSANGITPPSQITPPVHAANERPQAEYQGATPMCSNHMETRNFSNVPQPCANTAPMPGDPITMAKSLVWNGRGIYQGKTLGEILATAPKQIIWLAETWNGAGPLKDGAIALLPEAKKLTGK